MQYTFNKRFLWALLTAVMLGFIFWIIAMVDTGRTIVGVQYVHQIPYGDKLAHFLLYGLLAFLADLALGHRKVRLGKFEVPLAAILVGTFAIGEEFTQIALRSRNFEVADMIGDVLGISLAVWLAEKL